MMVELVLLERIEKLGQIGDVVKVRPGYARNFLLPQQKALRATKENISLFESRKAQIVADNLKRKSEAESVAAKIKGLIVTMIRQAGESGQLFGSVTARDISEAVSKAGFSINKGQVLIALPIKTLGISTVHVILHPEVTVDVFVNVAKTEEEAKVQAQKLKPAKTEEKVAAADMGDMPQPDADLSEEFAKITK
ncbi:MAG: 50S ribosomal protein L9 [Alphaproteobacteria bacterium]|nr:50S ribosomal protein L9 [Alphaproteobacteria bacterium]